ncbi:hypothetical protein L228DRAFT_219379 [Xylona heveae TC161]|uniref:Dicer-like protein 1 n=1 Tax=Xylona heveae (strain CBS 132557 / TC161) TaxID=1328760 RepID=A0A165H820_XYLHT|nr:hypothetical protein L228DRAFT_219379 [Xylona heveae TC161]KZF23112.1 hypothetical protein L228DRAFT_219379 [Xylona heveae TC161]
MLSTKNLISKHGLSQIISSPRGYQVELFERAKHQNTIAVLDTGSGKTLIAVLLLRHMIDRELADRGAGKPKRVSFFVVDCVTLVFQQYSVLECNLDHKMERFCGEMGCDLWSKETWQQHFEENMVIVCTADVLYNCLSHSFLNMSQINLLILDEAHHAKKNHPYARIIMDFYLSEPDETRRPKIFGMTASPVDAKVDVIQAARELETLLCSQIATTSDLALLQKSVSRPLEIIGTYDPPPSAYETPLHQQLKSVCGDVEVFSKLFFRAKEATAELGPWCADRLWEWTLLEEHESKIESHAEKRILETSDPNAVEKLDAAMEKIQQARKFVSEHTFQVPNLDSKGMSAKVRLLCHYLNLFFERPTQAKCIVFVRQRHTARLLVDLVQRIGTEHIKVALLVGTRAGEVGDLSVSFRQQMVTLMKFRQGEINCLFATSIAEEGLDIPDCNLVIRFDLYSTLIQYIQSRGRARHVNSRYIHMVQRGHEAHAKTVHHVRRAEGIMRGFCEALPADRILQGDDYDLDAALFREKDYRAYIEPETKARLTYGSTLAVLARFIGCLPHDSECVPKVDFVMSSHGRSFICEVILPENAPIRSAIGRAYGKKSLAKRSAAFEACLLLRKKHYLDANLLPTIQKQLPAMRNALLALNMKKTNTYTMRAKPDFWEETWGSVPEGLFMTVLELANPEALGRPYQPLAMLTRKPFPEIPNFVLHLEAGQTSEVRCAQFKPIMSLSHDFLERLTSFTFRIFQDIFNKKYEIDLNKVSYWLSPIHKDMDINEHITSPADLLDMQTIEAVFEKEELEWTPETPDSFLENRFLVDRWDGGRRFFSICVDPTMQPQDPVPPDTAPGKYMENILDYSVSLFKKSRARAKWIEKQPVILADKVVYRRNWLDAITTEEQSIKTKCYVCPEPLKFSVLPTSVAAMGVIFPAIVSRLESYLVALEGFATLGLQAKPELALEAMTKDSDNTEEHREEQIHVRRGMGKNYERLEFIGDCFLKMATSIALFAQMPDNDEFEYHVKRMLLVCNKNLFEGAKQLKLYEYIRSQGFSRRLWYPEGLKLLEGKGANKTGKEVHTHILGDKTVADVCEAMIGASLVSFREGDDFDMAVKAVTALVHNEHHHMLQWSDYYKAYKRPAYMTARATASQLDSAAKIETKHAYHFKYPRLLRSAFIHPSCGFSFEKVPTYQRLEFLGDSLLDMTAINFLFYNHPNKDPQWLTEHKMAMVSNKFLGALCIKLGFHKHLRYHGPLGEITNYVTELEEVERESEGARDYWTQVSNPPKCLPDIVESYVGAVFVDSEFNFAEVQRFFDTHIRWFFEDMSIYDTFANNHPTTFLHNLLLHNYGCQNYRLLAQELPAVDGLNGAPTQVVAAVIIHNQVVADGSAASGKTAKVKASQKALEVLTGLAPFEYRKMYKCDCEVKDADGNVDMTESKIKINVEKRGDTVSSQSGRTAAESTAFTTSISPPTTTTTTTTNTVAGVNADMAI